MFEYNLVGLLIALALAGLVVTSYLIIYYVSSFLIKCAKTLYKWVTKQVREINNCE